MMGVGIEEQCQRPGQPFRRGQVEALIGPVGVGPRAEHPCRHHLRVREPLCQPAHERDGAALTQAG